MKSFKDFFTAYFLIFLNLQFDIYSSSEASELAKLTNSAAFFVFQSHCFVSVSIRYNACPDVASFLTHYKSRFKLERRSKKCFVLFFTGSGLLPFYCYLGEQLVTDFICYRLIALMTLGARPMVNSRNSARWFLNIYNMTFFRILY